VISPFGRSRMDKDDLIVTFNNFKQENEDDQEWWHLSCSLLTQNNFECILHNKLGSTFKRNSLDDVYFMIPQSDYIGVFSNEIDQLFIKEFRFYTRYLTNGEVDATRYNTGAYEDLIYSSNFEDYSKYLVPDYSGSQRYAYRAKNKSLVEVTDKYYHAICPSFTYYKDGYCYRTPLNKIEVNVFPFIDTFNNNELSWRLTVENSNFITRSVVSQLTVQF
jgi:hypothetical protein